MGSYIRILSHEGMALFEKIGRLGGRGLVGESAGFEVSECSSQLMPQRLPSCHRASCHGNGASLNYGQASS